MDCELVSGMKGYGAVSGCEVLIRVTAGWQMKGYECVYSVAFIYSTFSLLRFVFHHKERHMSGMMHGCPRKTSGWTCRIRPQSQAADSDRINGVKVDVENLKLRTEACSL